MDVRLLFDLSLSRGFEPQARQPVEVTIGQTYRMQTTSVTAKKKDKTRAISPVLFVFFIFNARESKKGNTREKKSNFIFCCALSKKIK